MRSFPAVLVSAALTLAVGARVARSQTPPFPMPNQTNPFPKNHHDNQNTGHAVEEPYWGVTNGNREWSVPVDARRFSRNGWVFPREAADANAPGTFPLRPAIEIDNAPGAGGGTIANGFAVVNPTVAEDFVGVGYAAAPAVGRGGAPTATFTWRPNIPGPADQGTRYAVYVWIPAKRAPVAGTPDEQRIPDARYTVRYTLRIGPGPAGLVTRTLGPYFVDQNAASAGYYPLREEDDSIPFFPFYSGRPAGEEPEIVLDNTTEDGQPGTPVIADAIQLRQQFDVVGATPTVTARHGGRLLTGVGGDQPAAGPGYDAAAFTADPTGVDPSLVSTLFQGPRAFVDTSILVSADATINNLYPSPLFSQMQVLVPRTEFIADPEVGVPNAERTGTKSIQVGAVYGLDWLTGTPLWRFPDRSFLPGGARNPLIAANTPLIPGIGGRDKDGDGAIEDDEVFIVGRGNNAGGGLSGSITFAPRVPVRGAYTRRNPDDTFTPVAIGSEAGVGFKALAFVGSNNGVVYALDAYGNNDNAYANPAAGQVFGTFTPGTTNVIWTFSSAPFRGFREGAENREETRQRYNQQLQERVPETGPFGASAPVVAWANPALDNTDAGEQRLFIGSGNGVLYAMGAAVDAGAGGALPVAKQPTWWFEAEGSISATPAVSAFALDTKIERAPGQPPILRRGVYFTSAEGRVYCVDWEGPKDKRAGFGSGDFLNYGGTPESAVALNDNYRFHNDLSTAPNALPDGTEGRVRPRWVFPNRYVDVNTQDNRINGPSDPAPGTGVSLAQPTRLGPIYSAPALMDFPAPANANNPDGYRHFVVVSANDPTSSGSTVNGKVYLLDAAGDSRSVLTNPTNVGGVAVSHPEDRYAPGAVLGNAAPVWMYRFQYGTNTPQTYPVTAAAETAPSRRSRPTVFVGGLGRLYAIDIDPATNVFVRWPAAGGAIPGPAPTPPPTPPVDDIEPLTPNPNVPAALQNRPVLARTTILGSQSGDTSRVDGMVVSGGPLQNRGDVPDPTWNPTGTAVNQDIDDPLTEPVDPADPPTFQYPALFVTTAGGFLHELSTNTEGEDTSNGSAETSALGWALTTDQDRLNEDHVYLEGTRGPGGPSGPSIVTNAVFVGRDPFNPAAAPVTLPLRPRPRLATDTHTGQTGFPLNANGLFYNPDPAAPAQDRQEAVLLRLPYGPPGPTQLGSNVAWVFSGGPDGVTYAYTPGIFSGGGGTSGPGGRPVLTDRERRYLAGDPKVDIFDAADFQTLQQAAQTGNALRPNRDGSVPPAGGQSILSRAAKGENNFFEWGETIYIAAWDLNARTSRAPNLGEGWYSDLNSVRIIITNRTTGATLLSREISLATREGSAPPDPATYPFDVTYVVPQPPAGTDLSQSPPLGVAFLRFTLDQASGTSPQTPGAYLEVRVTQVVKQNVPNPTGGTTTRTQTIGNSGVGANSPAILNNLSVAFAIANPLYVQGLLSDTRGVLANPPAANPNGGANSIGPRSHDKQQVVTAPGGAANDPDKLQAQYSQALANGNLIQRRDFRPYLNAPLTAGSTPQRNTQYTQPLPGDPQFYVPVAASLGYVGHGSPGSTGDNLNIGNRSLLSNLNRVRIARADLLWRWWPGQVPNADSDVPGNQRTTPPGMSATGVINPLPWEAPPPEAQPWKRSGAGITPGGGSTTVATNPSDDYTDIPRTNIGSNSSGGDLVNTSGTLPTPLQTNRVRMEVKVPAYQPANLVAIDNLTSTYVLPNPLSSGGAGGILNNLQGPVQLPRDVTDRRIQAGGQPAIVPFGYTARLIVFIDANNNGKLNLATNVANANSGIDPNNPDIERSGTEEAYREFEVWMGVPVDMKLAAQESLVDLGTLSHGFGMQNGLLGYNNTALPVGLQQGFFPPLLGPVQGGYNPFFQNFTVQNRGNVNLYNVRAAQRYVAYDAQRRPSVQNLLMRSDVVNQSFGIAAFGADPNPALNGVTHVATSLDPNLDESWNTITGAAGYPGVYAQFAGKHTLHKAKPDAANPTLLSLPDSPENVLLQPGQIGVPKVGVSVPIGTPVGTYTARLPIFEDHDTNVEYQPAPVLANNSIVPAGPLYNGRNDQHPGGEPILRAAGLPEATLRPRLYDETTGRIEYLPSTDPSLLLKASVQESRLTGLFADTLLPSAAAAPRIVSGLLPPVDLFPLGNNNRYASALTPAAYRSAVNGSLHTYFSRNATDAGGPNGTSDADPGRPFRLFHSHLAWNTELGVWQATAPGQPINAPDANTGRWFTQPAAINAGVANASNTAPFVLHEVQRDSSSGAVTGEAATLFWLNTQGAFTSGQASAVYYATLDENGIPGTPTPYLAPANLDPSVRRYGPKAVTVSSNGGAKDTLLLLYYGGVSGRWSLFYSTSDLDGGAPGGNPNQRRERQLSIPAALSSASEPSGVYRLVRNPNNPGNTIPVVDVYYTGISRANQNPDVYMTRYQIQRSGEDARLSPVLVTRVDRERLSTPGRDPVWHGRHISWSRSFGGANRAFLPEIYIQQGGTGEPQPLRPNPGNASPSPTQLAWRYDDTTGLLYQRFPNNNPGPNLSIVYVDPSAGTVRFRGPLTPRGTDVVYASYTPQTYRITQDTVSDVGASVFFDQTLMPATTPENGYVNVVNRRPSGDVPADRQWVVWQKGAQPGRASTLYYTTRRVGVDLKAIPEADGGMRDNESLLLGARQGAGGSQNVAVNITINGGTVPHDIDFEKGRIYVPAEFEGLPYQVTYTATSGSPAVNRTPPQPVTGTLGWVDEGAAAQMVSMQRSVNEGQAVAFQDLFNGNSTLPEAQQRPFDPTLQPGRVWLFWTSPRDRTYDIYWQTMAPYFESPSYSGLPIP